MSIHPCGRGKRRQVAIAGVAAAALMLAALSAAGPVTAQNTGLQDIVNRLDRLQREVSMLQRDVYQKNSRNPTASGTAAPASADRWTASVALRQTRLEQEIRSLTGQIEVLGHQLNQLRAQMDTLAGLFHAKPPDAPGGAGNTAGTVRQPAAGATTPALPPKPGQTGVLGTIPGQLAVTSPQGPRGGPASSAARPEPQLTAEAQYRRAIGLIQQKQDFPAAEAALRTLIEQNPEHELASNAWYWLGRTHYVRNEYRKAAFAFADGYKKHPRGAKAADNLFSLGNALAQLDRRKEACTAYSQLLTQFPRANEHLKRRVTREQAKNQCP